MAGLFNEMLQYNIKKKVVNWLETILTHFLHISACILNILNNV